MESLQASNQFESIAAVVEPPKQIITLDQAEKSADLRDGISETYYQKVTYGRVSNHPAKPTAILPTPLKAKIMISKKSNVKPLRKRVS